MSEHNEWYKIGFYAMVAVVAVIVLSGFFILAAFDRSPSYILARILDVPPPVSESLNGTVGFLPSYYYEDLDTLPHTFGKHVKTLDDFYEWKSGPILEEYRKRPTIHQVSHNSTMVSSEERNGYVLSKFTMQTRYPNSIIFYKLTPTHNDSQNERGTVLVIPGSGNPGANDVLGEPSPIASYYYQEAIAKHLVREGYDVYTIELHGYGEREFDVGKACETKTTYERLLTCSADLLHNRLAMYGISLYTIQTDEITQVLAHIAYNEKAEDIAVVGLSLGGGHATAQAIINPDAIGAVVVASGVASHVNSPISHQAIGNNQFLCCDTNDKAATIAPKPMYVSFGKKETGTFGWEARTDHTGNFLKDVYRLHGAEDSFYYYAHDGIHEYHVESVIDFLRIHLG